MNACDKNTSSQEREDLRNLPQGSKGGEQGRVGEIRGARPARPSYNYNWILTKLGCGISRALAAPFTICTCQQLALSFCVDGCQNSAVKFEVLEFGVLFVVCPIGIIIGFEWVWN